MKQVKVYTLYLTNNVIRYAEASSLKQAMLRVDSPEQLIGYYCVGNGFECQLNVPVSSPEPATESLEANEYPSKGLKETLLERLIWLTGEHKHKLLITAIILLFILTGTIEYYDCVNYKVCP